MNDKCLICQRHVEPYSWNHPQPGAYIKCDLCGEYRISERLAQDIYEYCLGSTHILSAAIREHSEQGIVLWIEDLNDLKDSVSIPKSPLESIDRILLHILKKSNSSNEWLHLNQIDYPIAYAKSPDEFTYFLSTAEELNYLEYQNGAYRLKPNGWKHLAELPQKEVRPNQAFVAMWFHEDLGDIWEKGLKPALMQTGYDPLRIDRTEHNEKIDDRIIAEIRRSGLLVADFTGQRGGVYFEAGFAMGLGIPVIWTCRDTDISNLHFDTRQYNHIVWTDAVYLKERLINRIEATLPNRPKPKREGLR